MDWTALSKLLREEPTTTYLPERTEPEFLKALHAARRIFFRVDPSQNRVVGCVATIPSLVRTVEEIGILWVDSAYRGRGHSKRLIRKALLSVPFGMQFFMITSNCGAISAAREFGFVPTTVDSKPDLLSWAHQTGITFRHGGLPKSATQSVPESSSGFRRLLIRQTLT